MNNNNWLDIDVLEDYLDGKLDAKSMHRIERLSLEDPFVAEALAGLSLSPKRIQSLSLLQRRLQDRIAQKPIEQKRWQITSQRLSIAAAAAVLFITVSLLFWMRESRNQAQIAANTPKKVEVAIAAQAQTTEKPVAKAKVEVDKIIAEAKTNTYANQSKKISPQGIIAIETPPVQKKEIYTRDVSSALAGRVAGLNTQSSQKLSSVAIPSLLHNIKGVIYDEQKSPIPGASVKLNGSSLATATNAKGEFSLAIDSLVKDPKLSIGFMGFEHKEVTAKIGQDLAVELKADNSTLNEVVIVGYGAQKKQAITGSSSTIAINKYEPEGGWDKFEEYIVNNNKLLKDKILTGRYITVSFKVNESGESTHIKVIKNRNMTPLQTTVEEKEAIRLVKEGPKWFLQTNNGSSSKETTVNIKF